LSRMHTDYNSIKWCWAVYERVHDSELYFSNAERIYSRDWLTFIRGLSFSNRVMF